MREWNPLVIFCLTFVHLLVVPDTENSLVDLEEELGLGCIVHCYSRPLCLPFLIIYEGACEYAFELSGDFRALDHFRQT